MTMDMTRRNLLRGGTGVAVGAAAALALPAQDAAAEPAVNPANVPGGTALIDVAAGSTRWLTGVGNQDSSTTLQGIAFDSVNGHLYTLQIAGASQVAYLRSGSQAAVTSSIGADLHDKSGDLCLTRRDLSTGAITGYMYLLGFGHGVSLGVEPAKSGSPAYVWTEAGCGQTGFGQEFVRFPFADQTVLWTSHPAVQRFGSPDPAATSMTPSVDVDHNILLIRYAMDSDHWFAAYDLAAAVATANTGHPMPAPLARIQQPTLYKYAADGTPTTDKATFQGFTSYGQYVYMLDGDPRTDTTSGTLTGTDKWAIHTTSFDLNGTQNNPTTGYIASTHSEADAAANPREPEGMAMYTGSGSPRLSFGITNNSGSDHQFDLYYKV
ncbi:phage baseplate protein [Streptomyces sp. NPDC003688]